MANGRFFISTTRTPVPGLNPLHDPFRRRALTLKTWKKVVAAVLVLVLVGAFLAWRVIQRGFSARETPSKMEVFVPTKARALAVPASYRSLKTPFPILRKTFVPAWSHSA